MEGIGHKSLRIRQKEASKGLRRGDILKDVNGSVQRCMVVSSVFLVPSPHNVGAAEGSKISSIVAYFG
jgi:hypothetical protein